MSDWREGGCLCGAARYEIDVEGARTGNCHCRDCQKNAGAPFMTFTSVVRGRFNWVAMPKGEAHASDIAVRRFCEKCGTPLTWEALDGAESVGVSTPTLDQPADIPVQYEIYTRTRFPWMAPVAGALQFDADGTVQAMDGNQG
ncbi:GFA family protein [Gimibacter soli]|uniref:GFA family protein n=1 Tax=Gimibacter soli TaxID=3024400 RepID=A0AAF0BKA8_9PROT|nr:GFA family protein [Gimibacter soli]WCL52742.1 GFA family protein [Gimibacter soli]